MGKNTGDKGHQGTEVASEIEVKMIPEKGLSKTCRGFNSFGPESERKKKVICIIQG